MASVESAAAAASVLATEDAPTDPTPGSVTSLIDRHDVPVTVILPGGADPLDREIDAELATVVAGAHRAWTPDAAVVDVDEAVPDEDHDPSTDSATDVIDAELVEVDEERTEPDSQRSHVEPVEAPGSAANPVGPVPAPVISGPWPVPDGPNWPREIPRWGAAPVGYGRPLTTVVLGFKDGSTTTPAPTAADRLRAIAEQLGA